MLPPEAVTLGIDEHTACTLDLQAGTAEVGGRGGVTILAGAQTTHYPHGETFALDELRPRGGLPRAPIGDPSPSSGEVSASYLSAARDLLAQGQVPAGLRRLAEAAPPDLAPLLALAAQSVEGLRRADPAPEALIALLIDLRQALRAAKQWQLSDQVRDGLSAQGISLQDSPAGTTWTRAS